MIINPEEKYLCLTEYEIIKLREKENRCIYCGTHLITGTEEYECWGRVEKVKSTYCPKCQ